MSRIAAKFSELKENNRAAFMPFLTAGDPDIDTSRRLVLAMEAAGADLVEIGIPFSDPMADGPTIQQANQRALDRGVTVRDVLRLVSEIRKESEIPIMLMGSYNPVFVYGVEDFCRDAAAAGADGLILPELLPEMAEELLGPARDAGLDTVFLIAPTSTDERLKLVSEKSTGFVYAVSLTGVTGEREALPEELSGFLKRAKQFIDLPIAVGFGISTPEMAKGVASQAEGVIIGSAIVKRIAAACAEGADPCGPVGEFVRSISEVLRG